MCDWFQGVGRSGLAAGSYLALVLMFGLCGGDAGVGGRRSGGRDCRGRSRGQAGRGRRRRVPQRRALCGAASQRRVARNRSIGAAAVGSGGRGVAGGPSGSGSEDRGREPVAGGNRRAAACRGGRCFGPAAGPEEAGDDARRGHAPDRRFARIRQSRARPRTPPRKLWKRKRWPPALPKSSCRS